MNFFKKLLKKLAKASLPIFNFDQNELKFQIDSNDMYSYPLDNFDFKTRHDPYALDAYTIKSKDIFIEHIRLDIDSLWNGEPYGTFKSFFRSKIHAQSMDLIKEFSIDNYTFTTYKIDDDFIVHLIYIYDFNKNTFIVDTKGELFFALVNELDHSYVYPYENEKKINVFFDISMAKENAFRSFFGHSQG